jgi:hypothetical protein
MIYLSPYNFLSRKHRAVQQKSALKSESWPDTRPIRASAESQGPVRLIGNVPTIDSAIEIAT